MNWNNFLQILRIRALEEADQNGRLWPGEVRRELTRQALEQSGGQPSSGFLLRRAALLTAQIGQRQEMARMLGPGFPRWMVILGWAAAFIIGMALAALGQEREVNLLALPLVMVLLWNLVVILWSLLPTRKPSEKQEGLSWILQRLRVDEGDSSHEVSDSFEKSAVSGFRKLVAAASWRRLGARFRAWLHLAAALLAIGSVVGMYARGWSKEYRAVWESTLLNEQTAPQFFQYLFTPASAVTGIRIPLEKLPEMRRGGDHAAPRPGDALPWIHLYAATLGLLVITPRLLLTLLEWGKSSGVPGQTLRLPEWKAYAARLLAQVDRGGEKVMTLVHGMPVESGAQDRWRGWWHDHTPAQGSLEFHQIPVGKEQDFVDTQVPPSLNRILVVFNLAATPEVEIHRLLIEALVKHLHADQSGAVISVALDDAPLRQRWSGLADGAQRLANRTASWRQMLEGLPVDWLRVATAK